MFGLSIMVFSKLKLTGYRAFKVKTGANGMSANKGAVALQFKLDETSFTFMNCHLCHG